MISVMALMIANQALFLHAHKLADGTIVAHAHPYDKADETGPYKSHHHTSSQLIFFENLHILFLFLFLILAVLTIPQELKRSIDFLINYFLFYTNLHKGRAPPASFYIF
jgi:hypothetical protein